MKRLLSLAVSLAILAAVWARIDLARLPAAFAGADAGVLAAALAMVVPLTLATAWRLRMLAPAAAGIGAGEANRLVLAASALNMVLPSKMGDIAKAWFIADRGHLEGPRALALVVFEKSCDMLSLLLLCALGLALHPEPGRVFTALAAVVAAGLAAGVLLLGSRRFARACFAAAGRLAPRRGRAALAKLEASWAAVQGDVLADRGRVAAVGALSVGIWVLHLSQIWLFTLALRASVPFLVNIAFAPLAILAGLVPLTFAGVGTRDAALVYFYRDWLDPPAAAALGLLCTSRYLMPAIGGAPFLGSYLTDLRRGRAEGRGAGTPG